MRLSINVVTLNEHESVNILHFKVVCTVFLTSRFLGPKYKYLPPRYFYVCFIFCACLSYDKLHHPCVGIYVLYMKHVYLRSIYGLHANNQFHIAFTGLLPKFDESLPSFNVL